MAKGTAKATEIKDEPLKTFRVGIVILNEVKEVFIDAHQYAYDDVLNFYRTKNGKLTLQASFKKWDYVLLEFEESTC